jgi:hypothetical protein
MAFLVAASKNAKKILRKNLQNILVDLCLNYDHLLDQPWNPYLLERLSTVDLLLLTSLGQLLLILQKSLTYLQNKLT